MDPEIAKILIKQLARICIDLPFNFLILWLWARVGVFDLLRLPSPTPRQAFGIAVLFLTMGG